MAVVNGSFEERGVADGFAAGWTITATQASRARAGFGDPPWGVERFYWYLAPADVPRPSAFALFDAQPEALEDFEEGWANDTFLSSWISIPQDDALFAPGGEHVEAWIEYDLLNSWDDVAEDARDVEWCMWFVFWFSTWADVLPPPASAGIETFEANWPPAETI